MAQAKGSKSRLIYQTEQTFAADPSVGASAAVLPFVSETFRLARNLVESQAITSSRNYSQPRRGQYNVSGAIELEINGNMNHLLRHVFGTVVSSASGSGFRHMFKVGDLPTSFMLEKGFTDIGVYNRYNGCRVNRWSMNFTPEGMIRGSIDVLGAKETASAASFQSVPAINIAHNPFDAFEVVIQEGGANIANCTALNFALENNLDGNVFVIDGTGQRKDIPEGMVRVTGTLTAMFENTTLYNKAVNHTESSIKVSITKGSGAGTLGNERMVIMIPELVYSPQAPVIPGPQGILVEMPFTGFYGDDSEATSVWCEVLNSRPNSTIP